MLNNESCGVLIHLEIQVERAVRAGKGRRMDLNRPGLNFKVKNKAY